MRNIFQHPDVPAWLLLSYLSATAYVCFFMDWDLTVLCLVCPAIIECVVIAFTILDMPWKEALPGICFVIIVYTPMLILFAWRWGHFSL
jgi:hypothetical protein